MRWLIGFVVLLVAGLIWLNGPGLRFLAPRVAKHFLEKAGIEGDFKVGGSLTGGLSLSDFKIESEGALAGLTIDKLEPQYDLKGLSKGKLQGLKAEGIHADIRLGLEKEEEDKPPLDLKALVKSIRSAREQALPLDLDLKDISVTASQDGQEKFVLGNSRITHEAGSSEFNLELGELTDPTGRVYPAQASSITWEEDEISIARLDPYPGIGLRDFRMTLPEGGEPSVETELRVEDAGFSVTTSPGFGSAQIDLRDGRLDVAEAAARFGVELPVAATLTSLSVDAENLMPDPKAATGNVRLLLEDISWSDWTAESLSLDAGLREDSVTIAARAAALGTEISLDASAPVFRGEDQFLLGDATGSFRVESVPRAIRGLADRVPAIDPLAPVPASSLDGKFNLALEQNSPASASAEITVRPADSAVASPITLSGTWAPDAPIEARAGLDGMEINGSYQPSGGNYQVQLRLDDFTTTRLAPWLAIGKIDLPGTIEATGSLRGAGDLQAGTHRGELQLSRASWARPEGEAILVSGGITYNWPESFSTSDLAVAMGDQKIDVDAALSDNMLVLKDLVWTAEGNELAEASATLPVPADFSDWKSSLTQDPRPIQVDVHSRVLSLGLLKDWVPALEKLDPGSTGQLDVSISGTYGEPEIDAKLEARDLRSPDQPSLPPADLKVEVAGRDGRLTVTGSATAPDFAPAEFTAGMPFRPGEWVEDPASIQKEAIEARVELPRLDISRFSSLVPMADQINGILTGNVTVGGTVESPEILGTLELASGGVRFKDDKFPAVENGAIRIEADLDEISLETLRATVAGGSLDGAGTLGIAGGAPGEINIRLRGDHLPVVRNESLIVRANANLELSGAWETATLSGTVGIVDSIFFRDIEILPLGAPFTGPAAADLPKIDTPEAPTAAVPEPFGSWNLNVTLRTEEPFLVRGNLANGAATGSIRVGGTVANPAPDGKIDVRDFKATLPFSTLRASGSVEFTPASGFDPILEIRGRADPRPYTVNIYAYGRASDPQLLLTSNPPLPENEIMTLLATGTTTSGLEDPQAAQSRALQLLLEELRRGRFRFGKQLRPVLKLLDRVDFSLAESDPYSSESFSTATLSITDRWFLSAGMGATGDSRLMAIWRLSFR